MKKVQLLLFVFCSTFLWNSCDNNDDRPSSGSNNTTDEEFRQNFGSEVSRDFIGQVVNTDNQPIENATVKIGSATVQTDVNGVFMIDGASVYQKFAHITATKAGYIDGSRSMVPTSGRNNVKIMLLQSGALETIQSGETSEVSIYSGTKVKFDGAFEDENGNAYSGSVGVFMFHLTPSNENIAELQPGMLYAETESGEEAVLQTFGMMNVELRGSGGQKLQIADGHKAEITIRIDDDQIASAPSTIPLWHFDEAAGWWKEDGSATKQGNYYVGEVGHFSWWNCDYPFESVNLTVLVVDSNGDPVTDATVQLVSSIASSSYIQTDDFGQASGLVPVNMTFSATVRLGFCGSETIAQQNIPALTADGGATISIGQAQVQSFGIQGKLSNCAGDDTSGYIIVGINGVNKVLFAENDFDVNLNVCNLPETFTIRTINSSATNFMRTAQDTNLGIIPYCGQASEYIVYKIDDQASNLYLSGISAVFQNGQLTINSGGSNPLQISTSVTTPGIYDSSQFSLQYNGVAIPSAAMQQTYVLNQFGGVGGFIDLVFYGTYTDFTGMHNLVGTAHVLRDQ